ncbi:hypothetical protein BRADI_5g21669v3 [Brachypodium distachyon]|uniref:GRF-type domain-containing protein n=1 Tax=Brachypodium distachyon TaxID=15368 RepID=A0A2K2CII0_BRADI|nr:hypothetical protein BRADI_5g21669v3 [Brachypodium distachyon]
MASSDPDPMPKKKMPAMLEEGVEFPRCRCGDLCKAKTADDPFSYTKGRRFFMCANYAHDPAPQRNVYEQPPSPPPLCSYYEWIDHEQPAWAKYDIEYDHKVVWEKFHAATRREEAAEKMKRWQEEQRQKKEEKEHEEKELREAERERKRERGRDVRRKTLQM